MEDWEKISYITMNEHGSPTVQVGQSPSSKAEIPNGLSYSKEFASMGFKL